MIPSEHERQHRTEQVRDLREAVRQGETLEQRSARREQRADEWVRWFYQRMEPGGDPVELLPDALASLEQMIDDRVAAAIREFKLALRNAVKE
jgi:hypothetical protein